MGNDLIGLKIFIGVGIALLLLLEMLPWLVSRWLPGPQGTGWRRPFGFPAAAWVRKTPDNGTEVALWTGNGYAVVTGKPKNGCDSCLLIGDEWWVIPKYPVGFAWRKQ